MNNPLHIFTVVGARPQFIKAAVVSRAIEQYNRDAPPRILKEDIIHTGQHYDHGMSRVFFDEMEIPEPAANLGVGSGSHGAMTAAMLVGLEKEMLARRPNLVLVYGDTNSTLAGALAAAKLHVPVAHVEAGMRSFNRRMPEEINRVLTDHVSDLLFCSSDSSRDLLAGEGITEGVHVVGDVMMDAAMYYRDRAIRPKRTSAFALCTLHRAENTDDVERLGRILSALGGSPVPVVFVIHPRTDKVVRRHRIEVPGVVEVVASMSYLEMLGHLEECLFVITDSGGLQKEAYFFGKKCITIRNETEWTELVDADANRVVGADPDRIAAAFEWAGGGLSDPKPIYGTGEAGDKIVRILSAT